MTRIVYVKHTNMPWKMLFASAPVRTYRAVNL